MYGRQSSHRVELCREKGDKMQQNLSDRKLLSGLFFRLLPYQILLIVINAVNGIIDSLYASNVIGKPAMSALGLYCPFNHFLYAASILLVGGSQILYGRYIVRNRERIHSVFSVTLLTSVIISVATSAFMVLGVITGLTRIYVDQQPDLSMFNQYLIGQSIGIPALVLGQQLFAFLSLENQTKRTMVASVSCFVLNAILNHVFMINIPWGTFGLGLSSSISTWVFFFIQAQYYISGRSEWKFSFGAANWKDLPDIFRLGVPGAISRFLETFRCFIINWLILTYVGTVGLSSFAASNNVLAIFWAFPYGMMAVCRMLFSINIGEKDRRSLIDSLYICLTKGNLLMCAVVAFLITCATPLTEMFYQDPSDPVFHMTVMGFRLLPLCMFPAMVSLNFTCYAQTIERRKLAVVLPIVDGMVGVVACSLILIPMYKMNGLYISNILNGFICCAIIVIVAWVMLKRFPRSLEDLMVIPEGFSAEPDDRLDITVHQMDEVISISQQIIDFCKERGINRRKAYFAGLCMEEMAGNVVTHGFSKDKKHHSIDVRVVHHDDNVILRIRDNCKEFNPAERAKINEDTTDGRNIGIRMVYRIADEVAYRNLLGLNVLTIKL